MAKCKENFGRELCHAYNGGECMQPFCGFKPSHREPEFDKPADPTPAELAQQLADLIGRVVTLFQGYNKKWYIAFSADVFFRGDHDNWEGFDYPSNTVIAEINSPVSYTGDWKYSKVTATPQVKK